MAIYFHFEEVHFPFKNRTKLKTFIPELFSLENQKLKRLDYIFCADDYLLTLNKAFLHHNTFTDILTFDLSEQAEIIGEIYISSQRVSENAKIYGATFEEELHRVIFHGALHLCGYGDKSPDEKQIMRKKENAYLERYFNKADDEK